MTQEEQEDSIDTIYDYTEDLFNKQQESLNRLDQRSSTFIGFAGVLIRLGLDLPEGHDITKILTCILATLSIIISALGLTASMTGRTLHPETLISEQYLEGDKFTHQWIIINKRIKSIDEHHNLMRRKQIRTNITIFIFCLGITFYALGVSELDSLIIKYLIDISVNALPLPVFILCYFRTNFLFSG